MRHKSYSIKEYLDMKNIENIESLFNKHNKQFQKRFGVQFEKTIEVNLLFESFIDANDFYQELKYNVDYDDFIIRTTDNPKLLVVSGANTLFDYFGTVEPNLLTISRDLSLRFDIEFIQKYSSNVFTGTVISGELLSRQCIIEVSETLPELTLAGLDQIASTIKEFELLLTRIYTIKEVKLL